jgi:hypothetical protein
MRREQVVVHHEQSLSTKVGLRQVGTSLRLTSAKPSGKEELTATAHLAFDADITAHELRQTLAGRQCHNEDY